MPYRVLVVDCETDVREAIRMTLEYEGYRIDEARSGKDGIDKAAKTPYDAILLDIKMPVLDGIEVLENLKEQHVVAPVIMVSGHADIATAVECTKRGAFDFLEKPLNRDKLLLSVRNAVRQQKLEEEVVELREREARDYQLVGESAPMKALKQQIELAAPTQAKVLRVLQEGDVEPVGSATVIKVDVRVIAATNKDLADEIRRGRFREDLYYRLSVIPVPTPPLRERKDDIPILAQHFATLFSEQYNRHPKKFTTAALKALQDAAWRGNVRELRNMIERLVIMIPADTIDITDLPAEFFRAATEIISTAMRLSTLQEVKDESEKAYILAKLREHGWNVSKPADAINTPRSNLYKKIEQYDIRRETGGPVIAPPDGEI